MRLFVSLSAPKTLATVEWDIPLLLMTATPSPKIISALSTLAIFKPYLILCLNTFPWKPNNANQFPFLPQLRRKSTPFCAHPVNTSKDSPRRTSNRSIWTGLDESLACLAAASISAQAFSREGDDTTGLNPDLLIFFLIRRTPCYFEAGIKPKNDPRIL
jgi:hypothetical protein